MCAVRATRVALPAWDSEIFLVILGRCLNVISKSESETVGLLAIDERPIWGRGQSRSGADCPRPSPSRTVLPRYRVCFCNVRKRKLSFIFLYRCRQDGETKVMCR